VTSGGAQPGSPRKLVAHVPDLMDRSKVRAVFPHAVLVNRAADLAGAVAEAGAELVIVDLSRPGVLEALGQAFAGRPTDAVPRVIGFASHVDEATLDAARAAGVNALPRSVFFRRLASLADPEG
jgi:hypothetical protein